MTALEVYSRELTMPWTRRTPLSSSGGLCSIQWHIAFFFTVNNGSMFVWVQLGFLGGWVNIPTKDVLYVTVHCKAAGADTGLVVPSYIDNGVLRAGPILSDVVVLLEDRR